MPRSPFSFLPRCARAVLSAALLLPAAHAAELGDIAVRSHIGQQLSADIELVLLAPDEIDRLQVRLAGPDVYQGANVSMNPALNSLRMSVVRRDGRHFLHLTTFQPVRAELLHLFLQLEGGKQSNVRAATLWLTPDPAPAAAERGAAVPPPVPVAAPAAAPLVLAPSGSAPSEAAVAAARARLAARDSAPRPAPAAAASAPAAVLRATPPAAAIPGPVMPKLAAAACTPRQINEKLKQCIALDARNEALASKLVELEGKVKLLQAALQAQPAPAATAASSAVKPGAIIPPSPAALKAAAKAKEKKGGINTMTKIAAASLALLLAIGVAVHFVRRKRAKKSSGPLKIWQSWRKKKAEAQPAAPTPAEPSLGAD